MTEADIYSALTEIFREVFVDDDLVLRPDLTAHDVPGWDSYKQIDILFATEERFSLKFTSAEINSLKCVGDLASLVASKTG